MVLTAALILHPFPLTSSNEVLSLNIRTSNQTFVSSFSIELLMESMTEGQKLELQTEEANVNDLF